MTPVLFGVYGYQCWTKIAFLQCCWLKCLWFGCPHYTLNKTKKKTCKLLQLASRHFSQQIFILQNWKHMFVQCPHSILPISKNLMFANIIIIITEKYSGCHRLLTLPWRQDNIELVIWWELIFHFWAKKAHEAFWTQGWKTSWSVISWWLPWKFQLPMLNNYVQSHW